MKEFSIIVAMDDKHGIGKSGDLAWRLSSDLKHFKELTTYTQDKNKQNAVIMGRKTWDSLPDKFKPLPGRCNIVLSQNSSLHLSPQALTFTTIDDALEIIDSMNDIENVFIIGGGQVYAQAISHIKCQKLYLTHVKGDFFCDAFFPPIPSFFKKVNEGNQLEESGIKFTFATYQKQ